MPEIRVGVSETGFRFGMSENQFWIETDQTGTVIMYFRGEKDSQERYEFVSKMIAGLCVLRKAIEP